MPGFGDLLSWVLGWWSASASATGTPTVCISLTVEVLNQPTVTLEVC